VSSGNSIDLSNLNAATHGNLIGQGDGYQIDFSVEWIGLFFTGNEGGYWTFTTNSDDGSYLWLGDNALNGYTINNALVNNGPEHSLASASGSIALSANTYYPIRILYGQIHGGYEMTVSFRAPSGVTHSEGTGYYFSRSNAGMEFIVM
jgi:hypothetical protein